MSMGRGCHNVEHILLIFLCFRAFWTIRRGLIFWKFISLADCGTSQTLKKGQRWQTELGQVYHTCQDHDQIPSSNVSNFMWTQNYLGPKKIYDWKFLWTQHLFGLQKILGWKTVCLLKSHILLFRWAPPPNVTLSVCLFVIEKIGFEAILQNFQEGMVVGVWNFFAHQNRCN